jgi:hypothetical protein
MPWNYVVAIAILAPLENKFDIAPDLKWQYVLARADIKAQKLPVYHQGELIKVLDYMR